MHQTKVLIRKNGILAKRNWKSTLSFIVIPGCLMLLLFLLSLVIHNSSDLMRSIRSPGTVPLGSIPLCKVGDGKDKCYTYIYNYAGVPSVDAVMAKVLAASGLPSETVLGLPGDHAALNKYMFDNYNTTQAAYVFEFDNVTYANAMPEEGHVYSIGLNDTLYGGCPKPFKFYECPQVGRDIALPMMTLIDQAILDETPTRKAGPSPAASYETTITPFAHPVVFNFNIKSSSGALFLMFGSLFPLVLMIMQVVAEKEAKLKYSMSLIGVSSFAYWSSWWVTFLAMFIAADLVLIATCYIFAIELVTKSAFGISFVLILLFSFSIISTGFCLSTLFRNVKSARMMALFYLFLFGLFSSVGQFVYGDGTDVSNTWRYLLALFPPVIFSKSLTDLQNAASGQSAVIGVSWDQRGTYTEIFPFTQVYNWLIFDTIAYMVLAWYLDGVMPDAMGVRRSIFFPFSAKYWGFSSSSSSKGTRLGPHGTNGPPGGANGFELVDGYIGSGADAIDPDVRAEAERIRLNQFRETPALIVAGLRKVFKPLLGGKPFTAVDSVSFAIPKNSLLCLLGPNGAGKTTTINMLTGGIEPTSGGASINGMSTLTDRDAIRKTMGVCPQFDVLWNDLTGEENLQVFAALKGMSGGDLGYEVRTRLEEVELTGDRTNLASSYSGGMRRRLSVAMALTCDPAVLFFDEPTTGMDPVSRRAVWEIIEKAKRRSDRAIILTTHDMSEATVLSDRVAIMTNGRIRCIGTTLNLKRKFGTGYRVQVVAAETDIAGVWNAFVAQFPHFQVVETTPLHFTLQITTEQIPELPTVFEWLQAADGVKDFHVTLTTLEDVFLKVAEDAQGEEFTTTSATLAGAEGELSVNSDPSFADASSASSIRAAGGAAPAASGATGGVDYGLQFRALMAKNYHLQKRRKGSNCCQICCPSFIIFILIMLQLFVISSLNKKIQEEPNPISIPLSYAYARDDNLAGLLGWTASSASGALGKMTGSGLTMTPLTDPPISGLDSNVTYFPVEFDTITSLQSTLFNSHFSGGGFAGGFNFLETVAETARFSVSVLFNRTQSEYYNALPALYASASSSFAQSVLNTTGQYETMYAKLPVQAHEIKFDIVSFLAAALFPLILFFQFPIYVGAIMYDKERKLVMVMKMMGMRMSVYWLVHFLFNSLLYLCVLIVLFALGFAFQFAIFVDNEFFTYFLLFILWGWAMISLSFIFSVFFGKEFIATVLSYLVVIVSWIAGAIIQPQVAGNPGQEFVFSLYPFFAFQRGVTYLATAASEGNDGLKMSTVNSGDYRLGDVYVYLFVESIVLVFLAWYLDQVYPAGYGVRKSPLFCCTRAFWDDTCGSGSGSRNVDEEQSLMSGPLLGNKYPIENEDEDVAAERRYVEDPSNADANAIRLVNLRKEYDSGKKVAVVNASFGVRRGECLGLLGHNGAGKTTIASMLSGLIEPTYGTAYVAQYSIRDEMDRIHGVLGVCPQHDLLWESMTAEEHLYFYGRLKRLSGKKLKAAVAKTLDDLHLTYVKSRKAGQFSGGMKRRLSIGMAMIGDPQVIFLDEPTTGLDPKNRRDIWAILARAKRKYNASIILTTHSMEEADALSDRIAIMAAGKVQCVGTSNHLKTKFATGYRLSISMHPDFVPEAPAAVAMVQALIPEADHMDLSLGPNHHFHVPLDAVNLASLFADMEARKDAVHIASWVLSATSLEDVFLRIAHASDDSHVVQDLAAGTDEIFTTSDLNLRAQAGGDDGDGDDGGYGVGGSPSDGYVPPPRIATRAVQDDDDEYDDYDFVEEGER